MSISRRQSHVISVLSYILSDANNGWCVGVDEQMDGLGGRAGLRTDGRTDGWREGWMNGIYCVLKNYPIKHRQCNNKVNGHKPTLVESLKILRNKLTFIQTNQQNNELLAIKGTNINLFTRMYMLVFFLIKLLVVGYFFTLINQHVLSEPVHPRQVVLVKNKGLKKNINVQ